MFRFLAISATSVGLLVSTSGFLHAETVLRYNRWLPVKHHLEQNVFIPWMKMVAKVTNGRVRVEPTTSSLAPLPKQHELVVGGLADVVFTGQAYTPGLFPLAEILQLPFPGDNVEKLSVAYWKVYEKHFKKAKPYPRTKLLGLAATPTYHYFNKVRPIINPSDLKGLKLRVVGSGSVTLQKSLGVVPVSASFPKLVEMLTKGVVDGTVLTDDAMFAFRLVKHVKFRTYVPKGLGSNAVVMLMNKRKWASISPADRKAIDKISGLALSRQMGRSFEQANQKARAGFGKLPLKSSNASAALVTQIKEMSGLLEKAWFNKAKKKGVDGPAALKMLRAIAAQ